ncbi:TetR/AcrR family transcriptional regulator [Mycobacterium sp. SMC-4]|uniref:TetR/AcrR family transcriptional regulator n=1 Tax=Mycobacterium sp. SMC-4 TaxID=2857059 RepID=UPI0021B3ED2E|nr:TetR/AcrR family transcriptional regulator [Mycobacterium sp. SMC-4]UXA18828.1 TetR/AcrR family transcriptional regulator [Mycobacterium sp. SMC-4]
MTVPGRSSEVVAPRRGRGRRPAAEVRRAVLDATVHLLYTDGLTAVTFERVAAAAGASKVTLYKWWPSPAVLAFEAYHADVRPVLAFPDTGEFLSDLRTQMHAFVRTLMERPVAGGRTRGQVIAEMVGAAQADETFARAFHEYYTHPRQRLTIERFEQARRHDQIPDHIDLPSLADQLWGACYHRVMLFGESLDNAYVDTLIRNLFGDNLSE